MLRCLVLVCHITANRIRFEETYCLKMATKMLQACKAFIAGLTWVRPLPSVTAQVTLQVCFPLHCVCTKGAFEAHYRVGVCKIEEKRLDTIRLPSFEGYTHATVLKIEYFSHKMYSPFSLTFIKVSNNTYNLWQSSIQLLCLLSLLCPRLPDVQVLMLIGVGVVGCSPLGSPFTSPALRPRQGVKRVMRVL